jgi:hypothetical protein
MKSIYSILFTVIASAALAQGWTPEQRAAAATASEATHLTQAERDAIMYINLARLYPRDFARIELPNYGGPAKYGGYVLNSGYKQSLIAHLNSMEPVHALKFDEELYQNAKCFAREQGLDGSTGHTRKQCPKGNYAENCSYGMDTGLDIALQWLIDHDVPSLGHRVNCLNKAYSKIGLSIHSHTVYGSCAVAEIIW